MPVHDELGKRMKEYEHAQTTYLTRKLPVAIRVDGRAFHTFTKKFKRPFDDILIDSMQKTMKYLCENISGCVLGYQQSDEITLILVDYKNLNTEPWFGYRKDKVISLSASMATMAFNKFFTHKAQTWIDDYNEQWNFSKEESKYQDTLEQAMNKGAMFDARAFNIPKEEVTNLIYWRQLDATRNSIQMVGQANFSHKELHGKTCNMIQEMLFSEKGINWNEFPTYQKRGSCCIKKQYYQEPLKGYENCPIDATSVRTHWVIDKEIPIFKGEGRNYIDKLVMF